MNEDSGNYFGTIRISAFHILSSTFQALHSGFERLR